MYRCSRYTVVPQLLLSLRPFGLVTLTLKNGHFLTWDCGQGDIGERISREACTSSSGLSNGLSNGYPAGRTHNLSSIQL
jgi:hypothetical protein